MMNQKLKQFKFGRGLSTHTLLGYKSVEEAFTGPVLNDGSRSDYGFISVLKMENCT